MKNPTIASLFEQDLIQWLNRELIAGNDGLQILSFFLSVLSVWVVARFFKTWLSRMPGKSDTHSTRTVFLRSVGKALPLLGIWGGIRLGVCWIELGEPGGLAQTIVFSALEVLLTISIALFAYYLVEVPSSWLHSQTEKTESKFDDMLVPVVRKSLRVTVVLFALVSIAQSLSDKPVSALLAGLGLGGLAFALAAQDTIKNLFGSLVIFTDKPFGLGDRINYDGHDGVIEEVGLRSTRLRRLDGHQVTIPNGELANKSIHNIAKRPFIRRIFTLGVTYDTTPEKVSRAKEILEDVLKDHEGMDPKGEMLPRVYFSDFSSSSLDFKCMYWYHPAAYWDYMKFSEWVNLEILRRFNEEGIEFAFPTQTIHLAKEESADTRKQ
jgi:MscS family membrane protein